MYPGKRFNEYLYGSLTKSLSYVIIKTYSYTLPLLYIAITDVMGPDEYHYNINNSVFTNYNAKLSLLLPSLINDKYQM